MWHFFNVAFIWSENRFFWIPCDHDPWRSSPYSTSRGRRLDGILMTWLSHLSCLCMTMYSMALRRISTWGLHATNADQESLASAAFGRLSRRVFFNRNLTPSTKIAVYNPVCISILLHGCEVWVLYRHHIKALEAFHIRCLQGILGLCWRWRHHWIIATSTIYWSNSANSNISCVLSSSTSAFWNTNLSPTVGLHFRR